MYATWIVCFVFLVIQFIVAPYKLRDMRVIFNAWWLIVITLFAASKSIFYSTTNLVWDYILIALLVINLSSMALRILGRNAKKVRLWVDHSDSTEVGKGAAIGEYYKVICWIQIFFLMSMIPLLIRAFPTILADGLGGMRRLYVGASDATFMSTIERIFYIHFGVFPGICACTLLASILWANGQMKFRYLGITALNIACVTLITGARTYIFYFLIFAVGAFVKDSKKIKLFSPKKYFGVRRNIYFVVLLILAFVILITAQRSFGGNRSNRENLMTTIAVYFSGGIKLFDVTLNDVTQYGLATPMLGVATVAGLLSVFQLLFCYLPLIGSLFYGELLTNVVQQYVTQYISVGPQLTMNAAPTMFYYFIRDFGVAGIFIGGIIVAYLLNVASEQLKRSSFKSSVLYLEILLIMILGVCWWEPYRMEFWIIPVQTLFWRWLAQRLCKRRKKS